MRSLLLALPACLGLQLGVVPAAMRPAASNTRAVAPAMIDTDVLIGGATLLVSTVGGVGLIAFTENAGKRNEEKANAQVCVKCKGKKVITCTICQGTGEDPLAQYVAGVQAELGGPPPPPGQSTVSVDDWEDGTKEVVMYADILAAYPPKVTENVCQACDGRGVIVCDNCEGTGLQPRFLERYSPDDFMD